MEKVWSSEIKNKLKNTPDKPGCYMMRDQFGSIIYVGKAKSLRKRLQSYFRPHSLRNSNHKNKGLIKSIYNFDYIVLKSNYEAIIREGDLIKKYKPFYNILWKDDKNFQFIRIDINSSPPTVNLSRVKFNDECFYFGPIIKSRVANTAIRYIEKYFGFKIILSKRNTNYNSSEKDLRIKFKIPELKYISYYKKKQYLDEVSNFLSGKRIDLFQKLRSEMLEFSQNKDFESAAEIRDLLYELKKINKEKINLKKSIEIINHDNINGLIELQKILKLSNIPTIIECFDISNISGTNSVGSMVVAKNGLPAKNNYRKFIISSVKGIDDPKSIAELIRRRYSRVIREEKNFPDLIVVDGGITQLRAAYAELIKLNINNIPIIGLAKRYEEIVWDIENNSSNIILRKNSDAFKVITRLRDESHRFAITFHRSLRNKKTLESILDSIDGIGNYKKNNLLKHFGSVAKIKTASIKSLSSVNGIGINTAKIIYKKFNNTDG